MISFTFFSYIANVNNRIPENIKIDKKSHLGILTYRIGCLNDMA